MPGVKNINLEIRKSLHNPIGTRRLKDIAKPGKKAAIVVDDITRGLPTREILSPIIDELELAGINKKDIIIIVATGLHRGLTREEHRKTEISPFDFAKEISKVQERKIKKKGFFSFQDD